MIWENMSDMGKIWVIYKKYERYGKNMKDMGKIWVIWGKYERYERNM